MCPFSDFKYGFRSSRSAADLLTVVSDRIARAFNKSGATRAVALDISKLLTGFSMVVFRTNLSLIKFQVRCLVVFFFLVIDGFVWFWMESLYKNILLMLEFLKAPFFVLHFSCYTLMTWWCYVWYCYLCWQYYSLSGIWFVATAWIGFWTWIWSTRHWAEVRSGLLISMLGKLNWFYFMCLITMVLLMWKWIGLLLRRNHLLRCWGWPSLLNLIGALTLSIIKTTTKKIGALIRSVKFLSPEVVLYLYKSTIRPCMKYCCHVWAGAPSCYLELLDKLQKRICRTVGPSLAASLEPLAHHWNMASWSLFYRYCFGRCSSELFSR